MIRVLLQDCHARFRKYRQRIDQEKSRCCEFMGEIGTNLLLQRTAEQVREQRMIRDAALENKFRKLPNPTSPRNDKLVHNLSSKELTKDQMQVLRHEASFNTTDAKPVNMIAAVESILSQTEATEETKSLIRHQVSSLLMVHRPREVLSKVELDPPENPANSVVGSSGRLDTTLSNARPSTKRSGQTVVNQGSRSGGEIKLDELNLDCCSGHIVIDSKFTAEKLKEQQQQQQTPFPYSLSGSAGRLGCLRSNRLEWGTLLVAQELTFYKVDIAAPSETRFSEQGQLEIVDAGYTFWSGRPKATWMCRELSAGSCWITFSSGGEIDRKSTKYASKLNNVMLNLPAHHFVFSNQLAQRLEDMQAPEDNATVEIRRCQLRNIIDSTALNNPSRAHRQLQGWLT
ncbi:hypothetical protein SprV_0401610600 [Sparganum proliferum]